MRLLALLILTMVLMPGSLLAGIADVSTTLSSNHTAYFSEDWEDGMGLWSASNGVWEVGAPSYGTDECFGHRCAATNLSGPYLQYASTRLESVLFPLPESPADGVLWLGFWHFFQYSDYYGVDYSAVQIWTEENGWVEVSHHFIRNSQIWTPFYIDISEYAGQSIRLGFQFSDVVTHGASGEGPGWLVDQIQIFDGEFDELVQINSFDEVADMDWDGWYPDQGIWELGGPTHGMSSAHSGSNCLGTNLAGSYPQNGNSRLISPFVTLPSTPLDGLLYFSFKQYCNFSNYYGTDQGILQIHDGQEWIPLNTANWHNNLGSKWIEGVYDISQYAGQRVRLGFVLDDNATHGASGEGAGWYIDDLQFSQGSRHIGNPERFENFATGWYSSRGLWEVGEPVAGPSSAFSPPNCWGTNLTGNYTSGAYEMLYTPNITLDNTAGLFLVFQHWYSFSNYYGTDYGVVVVRTEGGEWTEISSHFVGSSSQWAQFTYDLSAYAGQTVQFGFIMDDESTHGASGQGAGWYIDDFEIVGMDQNETPAEPYFFNVDITSGPAALTFPHTTENIEKVLVYGSPVEDFLPTLGTRLATLPPSTMTWTDPDHQGWPPIYYRVSIVDNMGNESVPIVANPISSVPGQDQSPRLDLLAVQGAVPNPFNPTTFINFTLPKAGLVDVQVYDISGRKVADLLHKNLDAGPHKVAFAPRDLASGTYFARVSSGGQSQTKKMVLLK